MTKTYTGTLKAFLPDCYNVDCLQDEACIDRLSFTSHGEYLKSQGYPQVGIATITVELFEDKAIVEQKVESLQAQLAKDRAESEVRQNRILEQISKLSALEYTA